MGPFPGPLRPGLILCLLLAASAANAGVTSASYYSLDVGWGYERQSSPLFQVTPDSTLVYLDGLQRLKGSHISSGLQGFQGLNFSNGMSISLSESATIKHSDQTPDLDFSLFSLTPAISWSVDENSYSLGGNFQRMSVAGKHFRDIQNIQADWTQSHGENLWAIFTEVGTYRHPDEFQSLDSNNHSATLQRNIASPVENIDVLELTTMYSREKNANGFDDLSSRRVMLYGAIVFDLFGGSWSAGYGQVHTKFDDIAFSGEPDRLDRTKIADLSATYEISEDILFKAELNRIKNDSTTHLYDNHYDQLSLSIYTSW